MQKELDMKDKKNIVIIATGGTIAGSGRPGEAGEYRAGTLPVQTILDSIPQIQDLANIEMVAFCSKDSNDITQFDVLGLKQLVENYEHDPNVDGIVITHGTDTLEETSFCLNVILNITKPVVMTGAMRPATATSADGPMNLYQSVALASSEDARNKGVLVVISDSIYSGRDLTKVNSIKTDAFEVGDPGPVGYMQDNHVYLLHTPYRRHTVHSRFSTCNLNLKKKVEIYYCHGNSDPRLLQFMLDHYDGLVLAGTGSGNYSSAVQNVIENYDGPCKIVRSSRLLQGAAFDSDIFDPKHKTIAAHRLSPHKARILLLLGLDQNLSDEELRALFREY